MIKSDNIYFRAVEPADIDQIFDWENDTETWHLSNTVIPFSRFDLEQYVLNADKDIFAAKQLRLMISLTETNETIGCVDLFEFEPLHHRAGIGIIINKAKRNKGFASESLDLLEKYCKETLNLHQLYCNIEAINKNSLSVFKKNGFTECGIKKDWNLRDGKWVDEHILQKIL